MHRVWPCGCDAGTESTPGKSPGRSSHQQASRALLREQAALHRVRQRGTCHAGLLPPSFEAVNTMRPHLQRVILIAVLPGVFFIL